MQWQGLYQCRLSPLSVPFMTRWFPAEIGEHNFSLEKHLIPSSLSFIMSVCHNLTLKKSEYLQASETDLESFWHPVEKRLFSLGRGYMHCIALINSKLVFSTNHRVRELGTLVVTVKETLKTETSNTTMYHRTSASYPALLMNLKNLKYKSAKRKNMTNFKKRYQREIDLYYYNQQRTYFKILQKCSK